MGKTNKGNRTKGNTRPASSGNTAQLLSSSGKPLTGFVGFDGLDKEKASYVPVTGQQISDDADSSVDSDFRMVMRKLLKRDAITRLKAVQEFGEHCVEKDKDVVKNVLPYWPRLFNKLAVDTDRRIREATHQANGKLLTKVRREMAPYLKNIMGVWLLGQCDSHPPAASAAISAFSQFPPLKQAEALMFCRAEIIAYFKDNLFEQTAKSMSEPNLTSPEEMESKYVLVISSTMQALKLFLTTILQKDHDIICDDLLSLVVENKFWKFGKHKESQIRGAWYFLVGALCQAKSDLFEGNEKKLTSSVFGSLSESDPAIAPAVWEAALSVVVNLECCWRQVDVKKVVLPQLWALLGEGGRGNARLLFPCLLPFLSKLPKDIAEEEEFLLKFFSCFRQSLLLERMKSSMIESDAILEAFIECLQFTCFSRLDNESSGLILEKVFLTEIVPMMEASLDTHPHLVITKFFPLLGILIRKTELRCRSSLEEYDIFGRILELFWEQVLPITFRTFDSKGGEACAHLGFLYYSLICPEPTDAPVKKKVCFEDQDEDEDGDEKETVQKTEHQNNPTQSNLSFSLAVKGTKSFAQIVSVCQVLYLRFESEKEMCFLKLLEEILRSSPNAELLEDVVKKWGFSAEQPSKFFEEVFLQCAKWEQCKDSLGSIIDFTFVLCGRSSHEEALKILDLCCKQNRTLLQLVLESAAQSREASSFVDEWLKTDLWSSQVVTIVKETVELLETCDNIPCRSSSVLDMCLTHSKLTLLLKESGSLEKIILLIKKLADVLFFNSASLSKLNFEYGAKYVCSNIKNILRSSSECWTLSATEELVKLIFTTSMKCSDEGNLSNVLLSCWEECIKTVDSKNKNCVVAWILCQLHEDILKAENLPHILKHSKALIRCMQESVKDEDDYESFVLFMESLLPSEEEWLSLREGLVINILPSITSQKLFVPLDCIHDKQFCPKKTGKLFLTTDLVADLLIYLSCSIPNYRTKVQSVEQKYIQSYLEKSFLSHSMHFLWYLCFMRNRGNDLKVPKAAHIHFEENCKEFLYSLSCENRKVIGKKLFNLSLTSMDWALVFDALLKMYPEVLDIEWVRQMIEIAEIETNYINLQIFIQLLPVKTRRKMLSDYLWEVHQTQPRTSIKSSRCMSAVTLYMHVENILLPPEMATLVSNILEAIFDHQFRGDEDLKRKFEFHAISFLSSAKGCITSPDLWEEFANLAQKCFELKTSETILDHVNDPVAIFTLNQTVTLFKAMADFCVKQNMNEVVKEYISEKMHLDMLYLFIDIAEACNGGDIPNNLAVFLPVLTSAVDSLSSEVLLNLFLSKSVRLGKQKLTLLEYLMALFYKDTHPLQLAAHSMLWRIMVQLPKKLASEDEDAAASEKSEEDDGVVALPKMLHPLVSSLSALDNIMDQMLNDIQIGDECIILPEGDSFTVTLAFLLEWTSMLHFIASAPSQVRLGYAADLEKENLVTSFLNKCFCLSPPSPASTIKKLFSVNEPKKEDYKKLFMSFPSLQTSELISEHIEALACYVFTFALRAIPASIRIWWNNLDRKSVDIVNNFTAKHISSHLCTYEIQAVQDGVKSFKDIVVQARPGSREVVATYTVDECTFELSIQLPVNHPLGPVVAERKGKVVIGQMEWRHWLMQLTTLLTHQNGSIVDGLQLWQSNLQKKFEGVEECMICYYVLHTATLRLPRLSCHVCRKKFHSACLYKWFSTSNKSTCPLCRNEFVM